MPSTFFPYGLVRESVFCLRRPFFLRPLAGPQICRAKGEGRAERCPGLQRTSALSGPIAHLPSWFSSLSRVVELCRYFWL
jgi:hypothetical protein